MGVFSGATRETGARLKCRRGRDVDEIDVPRRPALSDGLAGEEVTHEVRIPLVCYTGDTSPRGLDEFEPAFQSQILITELTFYRPEHRREKIHKFGHMHLDDFLDRADRFENQLIILSHLSTRTHEAQAQHAIRTRMPEQLLRRVQLWT